MPAPTPITIEQIERAARKLAELRPAYAAIIAFYANVFTAQEESKHDIDLDPIRLAPETIASKQRKGLPLVDVSAFRIDGAAGAALMAEICRLITTHETEIRDTASQVAEALERRDLDPQRLFQGLLAGDDAYQHTTAERIGVDREALAFIAYHSIQPAIELCAVQLATHLDADTVRRRSGCPVCGSPPGMALLEHEGRRVLSCSFCRHQWRAPRIFCALCENTQPSLLHYFFAEEEKDLRVDVCDHCHQYLKAVDTRELIRPVFPPLEQIASLHLDMIAAEKGYTSGIELNLER